jgi:streptogramin lyase
MSALGSCGNLGAAQFVLNEVTTVASAYALAQFMTTGSTAVGTSSTNLSSLTNAFRTVTNLYDSETGQTRTKTPAGNGTVPTTTINALANVLAACVDSAGGSAACSKLFQVTTVGGTAPRDTLASILNVARNPGMNLGSLTLSGPHSPTLAGAPNDWTLSVEYTGGGLNQGQLIAVDGAGNVWVPNAIDPGTLSEFSALGEPLSGNSGFTGGGLSCPQAVAVDQLGNVWAANWCNNTVSKHSSGGTALSGSGFMSSGTQEPSALAIDGNGNVFTANAKNDTVTKFNASGNAVAQFQQGGLDFPYSVAVDNSQNVWIANNGNSNSVSKFSNTGTAASPTGITGGGLKGAVGVAIDANGNAWVANFDDAMVSKIDSSGAPLSGAGYAVPADVAWIAVDGNNTIWTANTDGSISHLANTGAAISPATGYISNGATGAVGLAVDGSGNVWTTDNSVNSLFEYIGAATPVAVPLQAAVKNNMLGKRP